VVGAAKKTIIASILVQNIMSFGPAIMIFVQTQLFLSKIMLFGPTL